MDGAQRTGCLPLPEGARWYASEAHGSLRPTHLARFYWACAVAPRWLRFEVGLLPAKSERISELGRLRLRIKSKFDIFSNWNLDEVVAPFASVRACQQFDTRLASIWQNLISES